MVIDELKNEGNATGGHFIKRAIDNWVIILESMV